jgi:hypothetical protein
MEELCTDHGFDFKKLPAVSPELNPIARFFEELRKELADHVFDTIEQVEEHLTTILQKYYQNHKLLCSSPGSPIYPYLLESGIIPFSISWHYILCSGSPCISACSLQLIACSLYKLTYLNLV